MPGSPRSAGPAQRGHCCSLRAPVEPRGAPRRPAPGRGRRRRTYDVAPCPLLEPRPRLVSASAGDRFSRRAKKSAATKSDTPGPTVVLLVRHGVTPTTGKVLPGRPAGCTSHPRGTPRRTPSLRASLPSPPPRRPLRLAARTDEGDGEADRRGARTARDHRPRAARVRLRRVDRKELAALSKLPAWNTVQRWPSGFTFPAASPSPPCHPHLGDGGAHRRRPRRPDGRRCFARRPDQGGGGLGRRRAARPLPALRGLALLGVGRRTLAGGANILCVNSTASLSELALS